MEKIHPHSGFEGKLYGIELEIEAEGLYMPREIYDDDGDVIEEVNPELPVGWLREHEESIQGVEVISDRPYSYGALCANIGNLFHDIDKQGFVPKRTARGSTHVHANVSDLTWAQMRSFVMACIWAEPFLIEHAGKGRKGNLFAQSYETTPMGWNQIVKWCRQECIRNNLDTHYMATSFQPMGYLGSVEFRMGPSSRDALDAIGWLTLVDVVVTAGRESVVTDEAPGFIELLKMGLPKHVAERCEAKARRFASEVWQELNEPYSPPPRIGMKKAKIIQELNPAAEQPILPTTMTISQMVNELIEFQSGALAHSPYEGTF